MKKDKLEHIAIIMDGNGRWAKNHGRARTFGHEKGVEVAQQAMLWTIEQSIPFLSFYVFSTENWKRPKTEISGLFSLADKFLDNVDYFIDNDIKIVVSGVNDGLPRRLVKGINETVSKTKVCKKLTVNLCLNYGGRQEIVLACKKLVKNGETITEKAIFDNMFCDLPEPDLILRTGGQKRLSNFLLYQSAYSELSFSDTLWPDFSQKEFDGIVDEFYGRKRNFGGI